MPTVVNIPAKVRFTLYLLSALGSVVVAYLVAKGHFGEAETAAWAGLVAIVNGLAAARTDLSDASNASVTVTTSGDFDAAQVADAVAQEQARTDAFKPYSGDSKRAATFTDGHEDGTG